MPKPLSLNKLLKVSMCMTSIFVASIQALAKTNGAQEVNVGILLPLTGTQAFYGKDTKNGIDLAISELKNSQIKIKVFVEDSQSLPSESAKAINKLISSDKVSAVIGDSTSTNTLAAGSIAEKAKIPLISPSATNDSITLDKKYLFRVCFKDSFQGVVMANFSRQNLKAKTAMVLEDSDSDYSSGLSKTFVKTFESQGGKVFEVLKYSQKDTSFTAQLGDVRKLKPDVLFIPGFHQQVGVIMREAKDLQIKSKIIGGDGWDTPELRMIAKGSENESYFSNHYSEEIDNPKLKNFISKYSKKYKTKPSSFAALGYDSMNILYQAIQNAKSSESEKIRTELTKIKKFEGVTGNITIDKHNDAIKSAVIIQFKPNGYKFITTVEP